jgi:adenosylcobinamide-GDP ribazoletransferase
MLVFASDAIAVRTVAIAVITMLISTAWLARKFQQHLGGYTGDCLGAVQQVSEATLYLTMLALWR